MAEGRHRSRLRVIHRYEPYPQREGTSTPDAPPPPPHAARDNLNTQLMQQLLLFLQQQTTRHQNPLNSGPWLDTHDKVLKRFLCFDPPIFLGEPDDVKAEYWLEKIESIFSALNYTEEQQLTLVVFRLEAAARNWWRTIEDKWAKQGTRRTWKNFIREFRDQYIPQVAREARKDEFHRLQQGSMTVAQYESEFHRLSKYAPGSIGTKDE
ncbi:hypothetical protein DH2020_016106 [Rehmannia glutinosa]|uniref:Retrotransposon gag domain-containing protein n=1 Tax=Rehmannia glutinosa TaxID=99300 RepID=A0ABR0WY39_REHGL